MGMAGCSAIDVLMILKKQRQEVRDFRMAIDAEREPDKEPSLWQEAQLVFQIFGRVDVDKAEKAVALSMEKYCSVAATLRASGTKLTWKVEVSD
jgi:putative redox protein